MKHIYRIIAVSCVCAAAFACASQKETYRPDVQAHRGGMGLYPEESLDAMINSVNLGVNTLEMDCVITQDDQVILSHDLYFHHRYATRPDGTPVMDGDPKVYLYTLPYSEIKKWDVGMKENPDWPEKHCMPEVKPLAYDVISAVEKYTKEHKLPPMKYNVEVKSSPAEGEGVLWPEYHKFVDLFMAVMDSLDLGDRLIIQSFDERALQYIHDKYPGHVLSFLWESWETDFEGNMAQLDFVPQWVSPESDNVDSTFMAKAHNYGMKVVTWTVDNPKTMNRLMDLKVEGIISNYPNILLETVDEYTKTHEESK